MADELIKQMKLSLQSHGLGSVFWPGQQVQVPTSYSLVLPRGCVNQN
jgi:hypothetical protein